VNIVCPLGRTHEGQAEHSITQMVQLDDEQTRFHRANQIRFSR
jgi:predicted protein tyrosine phosphatase